MYSFFFFQAEDGIRDDLVTGVQTCALPICRRRRAVRRCRLRRLRAVREGELRAQARDEEAARPMDLRQREQELGPPRMGELRPLLPERLHAETARVDDRLVLVGVDRANRVEDRPARTNAFRRRAEQGELELRQRLRTPAKIGALREDAEARARGVDKRAVEA